MGNLTLDTKRIKIQNFRSTHFNTPLVKTKPGQPSEGQRRHNPSAKQEARRINVVGSESNSKKRKS